MRRLPPYLRVLLWLFLAGFSGGAVVLTAAVLYFAPDLPTVESLRDIRLQTPLRVYSRDGALIGEFGEQRRTPIRYDDVPRDFILAILAAEDDRFYDHGGVDLKGLLRAATQLITSGQIQSGGSTITMQVARNYFLSSQQTFTRKFNEILLALRIERELSKQQILELYINKIYLGNRAYGIEAAANVYYGQSIGELNLAQLAMIAGLPKAPSAYNPLVNPARALVRRNWILGRMQQLDYIDQATYDAAVAEPVSAAYHGPTLDLAAPYVAEMARIEALEQLGPAAYTDGYQVITTVDSRLQAAAQQAVIDGLMAYDRRHGWRGVEAQLPQPEDGSLAPWLDVLADTATVGTLEPAVVTAVQEQSAQLLRKTGETVTLTWEQGLAAARPYINVNRRGPPPETASDVLAVGDLVRLQPTAEGFVLAQLPEAQAALVALNPDDGAVLSLVGGFDFYQSHFNRVTQAARQPGSNFKPFIYTAALEHGMTPATVINDAPVVFDDASLESTWRPENASGRFYGPTRLRKALYNSRNLVSIRVLRAVGVGQTIDSVAKFGFPADELPRDLSLALGSYAMPPLEIVTGYASFANGGYKVAPYLIQQILDRDNNLVFEAMPETVCRECDALAEDAEPLGTQLSDAADAQATAETAPPSASDDAASDPEGIVLTAAAPGIPLDAETAPAPTPLTPPARRILDERTWYIIDSMLQDVIRRGTGVRAKQLGRDDLAGKTGTTNGPTDAWFSGYNGQVVATTWLGFDQNQPLGRGEYGGSAALPIWIDFMAVALEGVPETARIMPDGLVTVRIDPETGERAAPGDPDAIFEVFRAENAPEESRAGNGDNTSADPYAGEALPEELF